MLATSIIVTAPGYLQQQRCSCHSPKMRKKGNFDLFYRPGQQDLRGAEHAEPGLGLNQPGGHLLDDPGDLGFKLGSDLSQAGDPLPQAGQGLVGNPGQPACAGRAGQFGAGPWPGARGAGGGVLRAAARARS